MRGCGPDGSHCICRRVAVSACAAQVQIMINRLLDTDLRVNAVDSVERVKRQLQHHSGIPSDEQRLIFAG